MYSYQFYQDFDKFKDKSLHQIIIKAILLLVLLATGLATESFLTTSQDIQEMELSESNFQNFLIDYALDTTIEAVTAYKNIMAIIKGIHQIRMDQYQQNLETVVDDIQQFFFLDDDNQMLKDACVVDIVKIYVTGIQNDYVNN